MPAIPSYWSSNVDGRTLTTIKVGGSVAFLARPRTTQQVQESVALARAEGLPVRLLGGGSDLLLPDRGFDGVLVQPLLNDIDAPADAAFWQEGAPVQAETRYEAEDHAEFLHLSSDEETDTGELVLLEMGAGVPWGKAVMESLNRQLVGLHWFARIPCRVGGAAYNNIHGERHLLSERVAGVRALDLSTGEERRYLAAELEFGYDRSRFHCGGEAILSVIFRLTRARPERVAACKNQYLDWTRQKSRVQPSGANSGSTFQNLTPAEAARIGQTAVAAAWYIDQCGLKGRECGGMQIYPGHANFVVNAGTGTQADAMALIEEVRQAVYARFGTVLVPEVECIDQSGNTHAWQAIPVPIS